MASTIPQTPTWPLLGNLLDVDAANALQSLNRLADEYGEIYKLDFFGKTTYVVLSVDLAEELCDETRFEKIIDESLVEVRHAAGDGRFTARSNEPNWGLAHRILMPSFGPLRIKDMFDEMHDIASQLIVKWARLGPDHEISLTSDMTRLTLDSIALCAMDMRFNSFYHDDLHEFVRAMGDVLTEAGQRTVRTRIQSMLNPGAEKKFFEDVAVLKRTAQNCIDRRRGGSRKRDLLDVMLNGKDPLTGEQLSEQVVIHNMITFLIAGKVANHRQ